MINKVNNLENFVSIAQTMIKKRFKPGFDGMSAEGAVIWLKVNGEKLIKLISKGEYDPMPVLSFQVVKSNGKCRRLGKLTAVDTVIQNALIDAMQGVAESSFSEHSFAYRSGKGTGEALKQYSTLAAKYRYVAKLDIDNFFDSIDHDYLRKCIDGLFDDYVLTSLIMKFVKAPLYTEGELHPNEVGLHQGSVLSPMLSNIYLTEFDRFIESMNLDFIRYCDDIVIFGNTVAHLESALRSITDYIRNTLKLSVNPKKTSVTSCSDIVYLGHRLKKDKSGLTIVDGDESPQAVYRLWSSSEIEKTDGVYHIVSNGILRRNDAALLFDGDTSERNIPVAVTDAINIYSDVVMDSGVIKTALKNNICVNFFDAESSNFLGSFVPHCALKSPKLTFEQLKSYYDPERRMAYARDIVLAANHNIRLNIRYYHKQTPNEQYASATQKLYALDSKIKAVSEYEQLLLLEAQSKAVYYDCFDLFFQGSEFVFDKRTKRPPENEINSMISFCNAMLYNLIAVEINKSALDIRIGFLHATNTRKNSLNLDVADIFKPLIVDRTVFSVVNRNMLDGSCFDYLDNSAVYLNKKGKAVLISAFTKKLQSTLEIKGKKYRYIDIIKKEVAAMVRSFRETEKYKAFRQVR